MISKNINTSYIDLMEVTPTERAYIINFIADEVKRSKEELEQQKQALKNRKKGH